MPITETSINELTELLKPGIKLSATIHFGPDDRYLFSTTFIGYKAQQYLIIDLPAKAREALVIRKLSNTEIVVRAITNTKLGHIVAFKTTIMVKSSRPSPLLFLRMPSYFASKPVRQHERHSMDVSAELKSNNVSYDGRLVDFSASGCAIFLNGENELSSNSVIDVTTPFSDYLPKSLKLSIVNVVKEKGGHKLGIRFNNPIEITDELKQALVEHAYLASRY
ncbi:flagellar brake protein [Vibrio atypicus]|jgi:c-di-GMP-binding flagellar brake protein YcgR|uniref:flagellar brake protein n=1 Tax=Vibrio atypicus TaxID=558271 RepID=UPI001359071E|nr:flagellar brake protein [Vibrio atypicus]